MGKINRILQTLSLRTMQGAGVAAIAVTAICIPLQASALDSVKFMIGANPGGGFDQTGRGLGAEVSHG